MFSTSSILKISAGFLGSWSHKKQQFQKDDVPVLTASPAVAAAVVLGDVFFQVPPDVDG